MVRQDYYPRDGEPNPDPNHALRIFGCLVITLWFSRGSMTSLANMDLSLIIIKVYLGSFLCVGEEICETKSKYTVVSSTSRSTMFLVKGQMINILCFVGH